MDQDQLGNPRRRSVRPKPAAESLLSSPPAIKFYESTIIRNSSSKKNQQQQQRKRVLTSQQKKHESSPLTGSTSSGNANHPTALSKNSTDSPLTTLKLNYSASSSSSSLEAGSSKENLSLKPSWRVVKLMMPDMISSDSVAVNNNEQSVVMNDKLKTKSKPKPSIVCPDSIVNEDICSSCGGLGNFICCDACPRSFHFTCAEPPLDPQNLPETDWFCCVCTAKRKSDEEETKAKAKVDSIENDKNTSDGLWREMIKRATEMNPKCFVMPRRFRYQPNEEEVLSITKSKLPEPQQSHQSQQQSQPQPPQSSSSSSSSSINSSTQHISLFNGQVQLDHCGIRAPVISHQKASDGYCHCCGRYGITSNTESSMEFISIPNRPIISCAICPLYWHLDCLEPPMTCPPPASATWTCPIHFTDEQCLALDIAQSIVQAPLLLPESAIRTQLAHKRSRIIEKHKNEVTSTTTATTTMFIPSEEDILFGISDTIQVPESIKALYV